LYSLIIKPWNINKDLTGIRFSCFVRNPSLLILQIVRGKDNVLGEVGLMFIGYNLSRCISVIGMEEFIKALKKCYLAVFLTIIRLILRRFSGFLENIAKLLPGKMKNFYAVKPFLFNSKDLYLYVN